MTKSPETDEEMAALRTLRTVTPLNGTIQLFPYDPDWPLQYLAEARKIRAALGETAIVLEHVGSTSIPGISAKPIIDILLAVEDSADEDGTCPRSPRRDTGYICASPPGRNTE